MVAASTLISLFRRSGWYVDEMPHAGAVWMKPGSPAPVGEDEGELAGESPART
jgi:hypothetical protein